MPRTDSPRANSAAAIDRPINPAAPVTKYFANLVSLTACVDLLPLLGAKRRILSVVSHRAQYESHQVNSLPVIVREIPRALQSNT